jgi:hypothetical protein
MAIEYPQPCQDINLVSAAMPLLFLQQLQIDKPLTLSDGNAIRKESTLPNGNSPSACIGNSNQRQAGKTSFFCIKSRSNHPCGASEHYLVGANAFYHCRILLYSSARFNICPCHDNSIVCYSDIVTNSKKTIAYEAAFTDYHARRHPVYRMVIWSLS